ncbi:hypothetical protein SETIT_1G275800v2 [Setaria italica]|uniref:Uncharacterized protein n=1 Tax=Setaria italica TaxID=4555 RepID=A0A368PPY8_SETIT|nr:hypothetical protein SETIT_1G275800v2 [Setaria italica]
MRVRPHCWSGWIGDVWSDLSSRGCRARRASSVLVCGDLSRRGGWGRRFSARIPENRMFSDLIFPACFCSEGQEPRQTFSLLAGMVLWHVRARGYVCDAEEGTPCTQ